MRVSFGVKIHRNINATMILRFKQNPVIIKQKKIFAKWKKKTVYIRINSEKRMKVVVSIILSKDFFIINANETSSH